MTQAGEAVGFVGLGNMGGVLASNLVQRGYAVVAHDAAGAQRAPEDVRLYLEAVVERRGPASISRVTASVWDGFATVEPAADVTRICPFVEGS